MVDSLFVWFVRAELVRPGRTLGLQCGMAAKKTRTQTRTIVRTAPAAAPIVKVALPRAPAKTKTHRRRRSGGGGGRIGLNEATLLGSAVGGAALGFIEKTFPSLPTLPIIGRAGAIGLGAYFWSKHGGGQIARDIAISAAVIAGYQVGTTGKISGEGVSGDGEVSGIAAQI